MDFTEEWKSLFPVGSVFEAPLLLSTTSTKSVLGPLFFNPKPKTLTQLHSSPSLLPPILNPPPHLILSRFLCTSTSPDPPIPLSTASSIASSIGYHHQNDDAMSLLTHNRLQFLRCPHGGPVIVFFSTGRNHDQVGFLLLSVKDKSLVAVGGQNGGVLTANKCLNQRIVRIVVNPVVNLNKSSSDNTIGYLLVYTMYSVHWFCVRVNVIADRPSVVYLGCKIFKSCPVAGACWNPHLPLESVVLLENGGLFLFDLESDSLCEYFRGTRLRVCSDALCTPGNCKWLGCEFSWHPRILIVARSDAVLLVDLRHGEGKITCLARIDILGVYASVKTDQFLAFSKVVSNHFQFVLASDSFLLLCDVRHALVPVLQWAHGLDRPCNIDVFRLSILRSNSRDNAHDWATESGFGIILGSFWNGEFSVFCFGPSLPAEKGPIATEISKISKPVYAWEYPSDLLLSGHECQCGSCLLGEEVWKDFLHEWTDWRQKKDLVLGFGILSNDLSSMLFEPDEFGGFTLIRLMSSGKLEAQRYSASYDVVGELKVCHRDRLLHSCGDNLLYDIGYDSYKFPRRFKYWRLTYLSAYLKGKLLEVLESNMTTPYNGPQEKEYFSLDSHEILCEKLKSCGFSRFRTLPAISVVLNDINFPTTIHEVALRRICAELPMDLLQLAFSTYSEFLDVLLDNKKITLEYLAVPELHQLPPFLLRKPSSYKNRRSHKAPYSNGLVGPVLPLPVLITLHELHNGCPNLQDQTSAFSPDAELNIRSNEVLKVVKEMSILDQTAELHEENDVGGDYDEDEDAVSLDNDGDDIRVGLEKPKSFFVYHPVALNCSTKEEHKESKSSCIYKGDRFTSLVSKIHVKDPTPRSMSEAVGHELFVDLCPIDLKFETPVRDFSSEEAKAYKVLKSHFSKWQEEFSPYREFRTRFLTHKQYP